MKIEVISNMLMCVLYSLKFLKWVQVINSATPEKKRKEKVLYPYNGIVFICEKELKVIYANG